MADFLLSAAIGLAVVAVAITVVLGSYFTARALLSAGEDKDRTHDVALAIGGRIAGLYGLILALVYAQELNDYKDIRAALLDEAVAVSDVFNDIHRYGGPQVVPVQTDLEKYIVTVSGEEWDMLGEGRGLSPRAWEEWDDAYERILDLTPATERQRYLANRMRERITAIARFRQERSAAVGDNFNDVFWPPAFIGLILLAIPFYVYRPTRSHIILLSTFGTYAGVILFFIFVFSNPFQRPERIEPLAFKQLLQGVIGRVLEPPPMQR
jgi:hypothetical protein